MTEKITQNKFMFFKNFLDAIDQLDEKNREKTCYEFCKYAITGVLPKDKTIAMFCVGVSASVRKYQGSGGARKGAGRKPKNQSLSSNQKNQKNQNNQIFQNQQTETETEIKEINKEKPVVLDKYRFEGQVIKLNERDFNKWKEEYPDVPLLTKLFDIDNWLSKNTDGKDWFFRVKQMLKKEQEKANG